MLMNILPLSNNTAQLSTLFVYCFSFDLQMYDHEVKIQGGAPLMCIKYITKFCTSCFKNAAQAIHTSLTLQIKYICHLLYKTSYPNSHRIAQCTYLSCHRQCQRHALMTLIMHYSIYTAMISGRLKESPSTNQRAAWKNQFEPHLLITQLHTRRLNVGKSSIGTLFK